MPCSSGSTRWCGAGVATSGPGCPPQPLPTWATTCGLGSGTGCAVSTPRPPGSRSAAATSAADRGRPVRTGCCSTLPRSAPAVTATGVQPSRHPGRPPHSHPQADPPGTYGEPVAVKAARRVREAVRGNGPVERPAPRPGPASQHRAAASGTVQEPDRAYRGHEFRDDQARSSRKGSLSPTGWRNRRAVPRCCRSFSDVRLSADRL